MKILLPVHHFLPKHSAGAELYTYRMATWLRARGHDARVVCFETIDSGPAEAIDVLRDDYDGIPTWRVSNNLMRAPRRREWTFHHEPLGAWFTQLLRDERPDLVHFQAGYLIGTAPIIAAGELGVPCALTLHDYWFICPRHTLLRGDGALCEQVPEDPRECVWCHEDLWSGRTQKLNRLSGGNLKTLKTALMSRERVARMQLRRDLTAQALTVPKRVIAPSAYLASRYRPWVSDERLRVVRYGLDMTPFERLPPRAPAPGDAPLKIGYIGQIAAHKGVHVLLDAFARLRVGQGRPVELHVYGGLAENDYVDDLRARAARDTRVTLHGRFDNARVAEILAGVDALVVPSLWYENMPLSILESYAAGTPVITTSTGGMAEPVTHNVNGLHFKLGDAASLAHQLQRLIDESQLLAQLQKGADHNKPDDKDVEMATITQLYVEMLINK
jgi:glycosyltransferase involved in cell wall biosynthesis